MHFDPILCLQDISRPIVPEVSLLFDEPKKTTANNDGPTLSYKEWREKQQNNGMKKKIVTFECPEQPETVSNLISFIPPQPQQSNFSFNQTMQADSNNIEEKSKRYQYNPLPNVNPIPQQQPTTLQYGLPQTNSNAFEQFTVDDMYKLLTLQKNMQETVNNEIEAITPQQIPEPMPTTKQKVELQDLFNLMLQIQQQSSQSQQNKNDERPTVPPKALETKDIVVRQNENISSQNDVEPTTRDLVNIIMRQQEQLTSLQNQVHTLVRSIASDSSASVNNINRTAPKPMSVMTSLEINVQKIHNKKSPLDRRIIDTQPPALHETRNPCRCQCQQMKSDPSSYPDDNFIQRKNSNELLNANMNAQFPQDSSNPPGFTLYGNILNQVNDVLQNSPPIDSTKIQQIRSDSQSSQTNDRNNYVASAQFKQFGIQFDDVNVAATSKR